MYLHLRNFTSTQLLPVPVTPLGERHNGHKVVTNLGVNISHNALARGLLIPYAL